MGLGKTITEALKILVRDFPNHPPPNTLGWGQGIKTQNK